ncbi:MAG TPA: MobF family relaxase [Gemmataceae bacterium]|jgi:conjugative relaxase-like TrwC/TraI family protein|nr:MobF family relaxase [Gemmataceae bacterium]
MLRINQQRSAEGARSYFDDGLAREDYYTRDSIPGRWFGKGAERLGLVGEVSRESFSSLCDNLDPRTGETLTQRTRDNRTVGYDFNFHAPKTLSLLYGLTKDERLLRAFQESVRETMAELEADAKTRVRTGGQNSERVTGNLIWSEFTHLTARPVGGIPDPHLHAHCFVFNATFDGEEERWKAGQFRDLKRDAPYFEAAFHARLSKSIADIGLGVERTKNGWEIAGLGEDLVAKYSRRTALIEELARKSGIEDPEEKARLGARTREKKGEPKSLDELRAEWRGRLTGPDKEQVLDVLARRREPLAPVKAKDAVDHALEHSFERSSVVAGRRLLAAALKRGYGSVKVEDVRKEFEGRGEVIRYRQNDQELVTTREVLAEERAALKFARGGRGRCEPLAADGGESFNSSRLNQGQQAAVRHVLSSSDRVMLIRGKAGTGKTTLLREAARAIENGGREVHVFAPTSEASRGVLRRDGFQDADTVARLLANEKSQEKVKGQVIWVDEAGLLGTKDLRKLFTVAEEQNARVVLMGDVSQHHSVSRGDALKLLESHAGLKVVEVGSIQRQQGEYRLAVAALAEGDIATGIERLDGMGAIREVADESRHLELAEGYLATVKEGKAALVVSPTHEEGRQVTSLIRERLRLEQKIGGKDRSFTQLRSYSLTEAERKDSLSYQTGDIIAFNQNTKGGFRRGTKVQVIGREPDGNIRVCGSTGKEMILRLDQAKHFDVFQKHELKLTKGDRIRITQNGTTADSKGRLLNGSLHTVQGFDRAGNIVLDGGQVVPREYGHLAHGYATTSHASQGKTVDRVFVALGPESAVAASREQFYVSVSRGREGVQIFCRDKAELREAVERSATRLSATELAAKQQAERRQAPSRFVRLREHIQKVFRAATTRLRAERDDLSRQRDNLERERKRGGRER